MKTDMKLYMRKYYKIRRKRGLVLLGGKCVRCGNSDNLHFDHIIPSQKEFTIIWHWAWNRVQRELEKCQLLCAECHRQKTKKEHIYSQNPIAIKWRMKRARGVTEASQALTLSGEGSIPSEPTNERGNL